tara:strand:+ start:167 stop:493 length:327 start_codon:yes stop_codon:yes gene_type:complete
MGGAAALAVLSASCCVLPIGLTLIGLGGSWLTFLAPFVAYREFILMLVGAVLAWSWYGLWRSGPGRRRHGVSLALIVLASLAFVVAVSAPLWEVQAGREMWNYLGASR